MKKLLSSTLLLLLVTTYLSSAEAQVTISPTNLFMNDINPFSSYIVINGSNETQEIAIDFLFSYSGTDEQGNRRIVQDNPELEEQHSIANYVRAFPRNFTLAPGQRQVVRLRLNVPSELDDGTYWARIKTASSPETPPLELQADAAVAARVAITIEQVTGLFFKNGDVSTGISITEINPVLSEDGDILTVLTGLTRDGNSPFLGSITVSLIDNRGNEVSRGFISTSIYFDGIHRQELDVSNVPPGNYTIRVQFDSKRSDIIDGDLVQMDSVSETVSYTKR